MKCKNDCGFYASKNGYCSQCSNFLDRSEIKEPPHIDTVETNKIEKDNRCFQCNKKLRTNILICKCKKNFCSQHILHTDHDCEFDFKKDWKKIIQRQNPKIESSQL